MHLQWEKHPTRGEPNCTLEELGCTLAHLSLSSTPQRLRLSLLTGDLLHRSLCWNMHDTIFKTLVHEPLKVRRGPFSIWPLILTEPHTNQYKLGVRFKNTSHLRPTSLNLPYCVVEVSNINSLPRGSNFLLSTNRIARFDSEVPLFRPREKSRVSVSVARTHSNIIVTSLHSMRPPRKPTQSRNAITTSDNESRRGLVPVWY